MKNKLLVILIAVAVLLGVGVNSFADDVTTDETADDSVTVAYSGEGTLLYLGIVDTTTDTLTFSDTTYTASEPGEAAGAVGAVSVTHDGGYLHYTLRNLGTCKITAETTTGGNYVDNSLSVRVVSITDTGSGSATLGGIFNSGNYNGLNATAVNLITGINDSTTSSVHTDVGLDEGALVSYELSADPGTGIIAVDVLYTIAAE